MTTPGTLNGELCITEVRKAVEPLYLRFDARLLLAVMLGEVSFFAALVRSSKAYDAQYITELYVEALTQALTITPKAQVIYSDGTHEGTKQ